MFQMDTLILKLKTPEDCAIFAANVLARNRPDLAPSARKRAIELQAIAHGAPTDLEKECLEAIFAYEDVLSAKNSRKTRAARTWQMIERHGIIEAFERSVNRRDNTSGYDALLKQGLRQYA